MKQHRQMHLPCPSTKFPQHPHRAFHLRFHPSLDRSDATIITAPPSTSSPRRAALQHPFSQPSLRNSPYLTAQTWILRTNPAYIHCLSDSFRPPPPIPSSSTPKTHYCCKLPPRPVSSLNATYLSPTVPFISVVLHPTFHSCKPS